MRYIELNPVRAGMVSDPSEYPWSGYLYNALGDSSPNSEWLTPHSEYLSLGLTPTERQSGYRGVFQEAIGLPQQ